MNSDLSSNIPTLILRDEAQSLQALAGEVILLVGEVGSGKTYWLRRMAGLTESPPPLSITINDNPPGEETHSVRMLFDRQPPLWLGQSVAEELCFGLKEKPSTETLLVTLGDWGLTQVELDSDVATLNRLEAARLALASISLAAPKLALLDSPTDALPEADALTLRGDIQTWAKQSNTTVVVTCNRWHDWQAVATQIWRVLATDCLPRWEEQA